MQVLEGLVGKAVTKAESEMLKDPEKIPELLIEISKMAEVLGENGYSNLIQDLALEIDQDEVKKGGFLASIKEVGLYFEAPNFATFDTSKLIKTINNSFDVTPNEPVLLRKELLQFMKEKMQLDVHVPNHNVILKDIFTAPIYTTKLKQEASARLSARDFGDYKSTTKQPAQGRSKDGTIASSSRLGHMELHIKLLHTVMYVEKSGEFRESLS